MKEVVGCCQRFSWRIVCSRKYVTGEKHWLQSDKRQVNKDFEITGGASVLWMSTTDFSWQDLIW